MWTALTPRSSRTARCALLLALSAALRLPVHATSDVTGRVTFNGLPVPGATVTAMNDDERVVTATDPDGAYRLPGLVDGVWTIRVEMVGFATETREVVLPLDVPLPAWELRLLPFEEIARTTPLRTDSAEGGSATPGSPARSDTDRAGREGAASPAAGAVTSGAFPDAASGDALGAADGLLINGSVNNAAASPFAQPRAFGNNRPGQRSLYNAMLGTLLGNSAWDARPFSFTGGPLARPSYSDTELLGTFGGPVRFPGTRYRGNFFVGYQRAADTTAITQPVLVPTARERRGDFSASRDSLGQPLRIVDPRTGQTFPGNAIPADRISPQAAALLAYYPLPDAAGAGRFNYQAPILTATRQDSVQTRLIQPLTSRDQLLATAAYQRTTTDATTVFAFEDATDALAVDTGASWTHRLSPFVSWRFGYQYTRRTDTTMPFFANRTNLAAEAGIPGGEGSPINWGPPSLVFSSGVAGLSDIGYADARDQTHAWSSESFWRRGRQTFTVGGDLRLTALDLRSQQDARGAFSFTGAATGSDLADFLLGLPSTRAIAYGNADKQLRARSYDVYLTDDWRLGSALTLNLGVRWEYEAPMTERYGRLVNLDVAPGFAAVSPVQAGDAVGPLSGRRYPRSLVHPDRTGVQPRLAVAWRPVAGSSLVIRGGYGTYRNTDVYRSIATLLAQQPPLSTSFSVANDPEDPFTLADGFAGVGGEALNTFAVDPDFRVGYSHDWQVSLQRDLPASLTIVATYLGSKGSRLMQQFLPNTRPAGAVNPCAACPSGFVYLVSGGRSLRNAGRVQLRRRLRNGLAGSIQYTVSKATDNAAAFGGAALSGALVAQDWLDLEAEYGPSSFDQRHRVTAEVQYTTGAGVTGGTLVDGLKGRLLKDWTVAAQLSVGSGLPLTPTFLAPVPGTGVLGAVRASTTGAPVDAMPGGAYLNPAAYAPPAAGAWGTAGRNSITGPSLFSLDASIMRTFRWGDRLNLDWRIEATNVLNRVTWASVNTLVASPQFGLPDRPNAMRKIRSSLRVRF